MFSRVPVIHFRVKAGHIRRVDDYECPVYKTTKREGVLSTRGVSDNFILAVDLATDVAVETWTLRGCALFCQLNE